MHIVEDQLPQTNNSSTLAWSLVVILTLLLLIAGGMIFFLLKENNSPKDFINTKPVSGEAFTEIISPTPSDTPAGTSMNLNRQYTFPIQDSLGSKVGEILFTITKIERTKEVMVAGQKASTVPGRELIIVDVELTNRKNLAAVVNTRNYLRLKVNNEDKLLAPEFHPDPLDLQPQSTKTTRLGFSIADTDQNLILQIGELDGTKDLLPLIFQ